MSVYLKATSNIKDFGTRIHNRSQGIEDNYYVRIGNSTVYAKAIEYGGKWFYTRSRRRPASKRGTFALPKGGTSIRTAFTTTVKQPPRKMIGRSRTAIKSYFHLQFIYNKPHSARTLRRNLQSVGTFALKTIKSNTPVDSTFLQRQWRIL